MDQQRERGLDPSPERGMDGDGLVCVRDDEGGQVNKLYVYLCKS